MYTPTYLSRQPLPVDSPLIRLSFERPGWHLPIEDMVTGQNPVPLVITTIALRWMFAHSKMVSIGIDPSPYFDLVLGETLGHFSCNTHGVTWLLGNLQPSKRRLCFVFPSSTNTELGNQPCLENSSLPTLHLRQHLC